MSAVGPGASVVEPHLDLFKLDWLRNPAAALEQGRMVGISDPDFVEMSAWWAELHAQLAVLAADRDMPLLAMGGNATALRIEASEQRGSRDSDYLTTASETDLRALMAAFVARSRSTSPRCSSATRPATACRSSLSRRAYRSSRTSARRRYVKEEDQRRRTADEDGPWPSIARGLDDWSQADAPSLRYGQRIRAFQASRVAAATKRPMEEWRGRARWLQFAVRSLGTGLKGYEQWRRALRSEARIREPAGANLRRTAPRWPR